jgi:cytochrome oxidase assembly protein ShyY1
MLRCDADGCAVASRHTQQSRKSAMEMLIVATAMFAVGLLLGSRWQYRRLLRQIYESAHR